MKRDKCPKYERFGMGKMKPEDFTRHAKQCPDCRENMAQDERLMAEARRLGQRETIEAPGLWERIEKDLAREMAKKTGGTGRRPSRVFSRHWILKPTFLAPLTAGFVLALGVGLYFTLKPRRFERSSDLLARAQLVKVEKAEAEYLKAIEDLEKKSLPQMAKMDLELKYLYKDRLATIDAQIERCREALDTNPANAHVRRYMLAALQDKKETLAELLKTETLPAEKTSLKKTT